MKKVILFFIVLVSSYVSANTRIVTAGNEVTDIVVALGAAKQIVATDKTSSNDAISGNKSVLGHPSNLSAEGILSKRPSLLISTEDYGPRTVFSRVDKAGVNTLVLPVISDLDGLYTRIISIGKAINREQEAKDLETKLRMRHEVLKRNVSAIKEKKRVLFMAGKHGLIIEGNNTPVDMLIKLAGGINAAGHIEGSKPITPEAIITSNPDVLATVDKALKGKGDAGLRRFFDIPAIKVSKAGQSRSIFAIRIDRAHLGIYVFDVAEFIHQQLYGSISNEQKI